MARSVGHFVHRRCLVPLRKLWKQLAGVKNADPSDAQFACKASGNAILIPSQAVRISQQVFLILEAFTDISITAIIAGYLLMRKTEFKLVARSQHIRWS